ncbi:MAG TPA: hypothetical protein VFS29_03775 [Motilibacteraceae bacterium]|nr:hypothetical protein [Motilibacteraceae bacterium]
MPLTEDDFRTLLAERAATASPPVDRVASVHRRIVRRRRQRTGVVGAVLGAALLVTGVALPHLSTRRSDPIAAPAPRPLLDQYADGGKLLASGVLQSPQQGEVSFRFTPTDWHLQVKQDCGAGWPTDGWTAVRVNGHVLTFGTGCGSGASGPYGADQAFWSKLGVQLGQPSTITLSLVVQDAQPPDPAPLPAAQRRAGSLAVGVYQRVPLADYPLPPRPPTLQPLSRVSGPGTLDSRDVGANGTFTVRAVVGPKIELRTTAVAPGAIRLLVNGKAINEVDSWRWDVVAGAGTNLDQDTLRRAGVDVADGTTVTVTVEASRFAVPGWTLAVRTPGPNGDGG